MEMGIDDAHRGSFRSGRRIVAAVSRPNGEKNIRGFTAVEGRRSRLHRRCVDGAAAAYLAFSAAVAMAMTVAFCIVCASRPGKAHVILFF
jgi:hypothetical protein